MELRGMRTVRIHSWIAGFIGVAVALAGPIAWASGYQPGLQPPDTKRHQTPPAVAPPSTVAAMQPFVDPSVPRCTPAAIRDLRFPVPIPVDEIQVVVRTGSPVHGAALVRLESASADRIVRVGAASKRLSFRPAIVSASFTVSLDPVLTAATDACIERVELRSAGARIATVVP